MNLASIGCGIALALGAAVTCGQSVTGPESRNSEHMVFISGEVVLEDGSTPPEPVLIRQICNGRIREEVKTDSTGGFSFKVEGARTNAAPEDVSGPSAQAPDTNRPFGNSTVYSNPVTSALRNCDLVASLPGYRSDRVSIALKSTMDSGHVGKIVLHPESRGAALTVSATTLKAPSSAKKAYEKGLAAMSRSKWDVAATAFSQAVKSYPQFAAAWYELGVSRQNAGGTAGAINAWTEALKSDPKYAKPYESLVVIADRNGNWADSEKYTRAWIQLDRDAFPAAYFYNAIANARLNRMDEAELAARKGLELDKNRKIPRISYVLGLILMQKHAYQESASCFRTYLELAPNAKDAAAVREELAKIDAAAAAH